MLNQCIKENNNFVIIYAKIKPNYNRNTFIGVVKESSYFMQIGVKTQAQDGKANKELVLFLSKFFDIPKSQITITKGKVSRYKVISIASENLKIDSIIKIIKRYLH